MWCVIWIGACVARESTQPTVPLRLQEHTATHNSCFCNYREARESLVTQEVKRRSRTLLESVAPVQEQTGLFNSEPSLLVWFLSGVCVRVHTQLKKCSFKPYEVSKHLC